MTNIQPIATADADPAVVWATMTRNTEEGLAMAAETSVSSVEMPAGQFGFL